MLPGVTVEASSPALIEKARSVVTDGTGQYPLEQLRGGTYTVVFTLPGFYTVRREGVELAGSFSATVNAELKLGSVEETVTVTGDTPMVDIQSAQRQRVIDQELLAAIPTGRTPQVAAFMIPGVNLSNVDVGGTNIINTTGGALSIHGGRVDDTRLLIDGITIANTEGTGWSANVLPNMGSTQEVSVDYSSVTAESITGGLQINMIPKTGGNWFWGTLFATAVNSAFEGSNTDDELVRTWPAHAQHAEAAVQLQPRPRRAAAERQALVLHLGALHAVRRLHRRSVPEPERLRHHQVAVLSRQQGPFERQRREREPAAHLAAMQTNKLSFFYDQHWRCQCRTTAATVSQEAANELEYPISDLRSVSYTATPTSRLLVEARFGGRREEYALYAEQRPGSGRDSDPGHRARWTHSGAAVSRQRSAERDAALSAHARRQHSRRRRRCRMSPAATRPNWASTT